MRLSKREQQVLDYLASHAGRHVPAEELLYAIWDGHTSPSHARVVVRFIRAKLGDHIIECHYSLGYRISNARAVALAHRCIRCGRAIVDYRADGWVCHGCGAMGERKTLDSSVDREVGRAAYAEGTSQGKQWTEQEDDFVRANHNAMNDDEMAAALDRTHSGVRNRRMTLRLGRKQYVRASTE